MGALFSALMSMLNPRQEYKLIIVGLDNAGKTTTLYKLHLGEVVMTQPTIGSNVELVKHNNVHFEVWDLGGQQTLRNSWQSYYRNTASVIMMVDSTDRGRMRLVKEELFRLLGCEELSQVSVLVLGRGRTDAGWEHGRKETRTRERRGRQNGGRGGTRTHTHTHERGWLPSDPSPSRKHAPRRTRSLRAISPQTFFFFFSPFSNTITLGRQNACPFHPFSFVSPPPPPPPPARRAAPMTHSHAHTHSCVHAQRRIRDKGPNPFDPIRYYYYDVYITSSSSAVWRRTTAETN